MGAMNPRAEALKVFEAQALAMRNQEDPIAPIEKVLISIRQETFSEAMQECLKIGKSSISLAVADFEQPIRDYYKACVDCAHAIEKLKHRLVF